MPTEAVSGSMRPLPDELKREHKMSTLANDLSSMARSPKRASTGLGRSLLSTAFTVFNALRIVGYLPTLMAIETSGQADQHSLITWLVFLGSNTTMALWLREQNGGHTNRAVVVNSCNALMCAAIATTIAWIRWMP